MFWSLKSDTWLSGREWINVILLEVENQIAYQTLSLLLKFHLSSEAKIPLKTEVVRKEKKIIKAKGEDEEEGWVEDKEDEEVELDQYQDQEKEEKEGEEGDKEEEKRKNVMMMD